MKDSKIQNLINAIDKYAVTPETEDFWMKIVDCRQYHITGKDVYSPEADRNKHVYKEFLSDEELQSSLEKQFLEYKQWLTDQNLIGTKYDTTMEAVIEEGWRSYLVRRYYNAIFEIGAIPWGCDAAKNDFIVIVDSIEGAINKFDLEHCLHFDYNVSESAIKASKIPEDKYQSAIKRLYTGYLKDALKEVENKQPKVLWESQFNDYLLKCTSLGGAVAKPVIGLNGATRRSLPETQWKWQKTLDIIGEMLSRWPNRIINTKTKTYGKIEDAFYEYNGEMGYANIDDFLDAYGFSTK